MKKRSTLLAGLLGPALAAEGGVLSFDVVGINAAIPDDSGSGISNTRAVTSGELTGMLTGISVRLTVSGGGTGGAYNGDLYAYLRHESGAWVVLLNRPGRTALDDWGYADNGLAVTFAEGSPDTHLYQDPPFGAPVGPLTGTWGPDGRDADPALVTEASPRNTSLGGLLSLNPVGDWTLFIADLNAGGLARLDSWGLTLETTVVPEPGLAGLAGALGLAGYALVRRPRRA